MLAVDKRYLAGFFDGEGCVSVYKTGQTSGYYLLVQLVQNKTLASRELFQLLFGIYGGSLGEQISLSGKTKYNLQLSGSDACRFLMHIKNDVVLKKDQVEVALEWYWARPNRRRKKDGTIAKFPSSVFKNDAKVAKKLKMMKKEALK